MSLPPILLYPGGGRRPQQRQLRPVLDRRGNDIREMLVAAATVAGIEPELLLACIIAESDLDPRAERWGLKTTAAKQALAAGDRAALAQIIQEAGNDISFGFGQRIVKFHYRGDRTFSIDNVLDVRQYVFEHPERDLREAALFLVPGLAAAREGDLMPCDGDDLLGALVAYNCGHYPAPDEEYWQERTGAVRRYREGLVQARALLAD
jgi:hypothetical protein